MHSPVVYNKSPPPVPVSTSLDGLEIGIPPPLGRGLVRLDKPLPELPDGISNAYGTGKSNVVGYTTRITHHGKHVLSDRSRTQPETSSRFYRRRNVPQRNSMARMSGRYSLSLKAFLTEEQYGAGVHLGRANHYFREKKWDIFPELGPQSGISDTSSSTTAKSKKRNLARPKIPKGFSKKQSRQGEVFGVNLKPEQQHTPGNKTPPMRPRRRPSYPNMPVRNGSPSSSNDSKATSFVGIRDISDIKNGVASVRRRMGKMSPPKSHPQSSEVPITLWKTTSTPALNKVYTDSELPPLPPLPNLERSHSQPHDRQQQNARSPARSPATRQSPRNFEKPILSIQTHFHTSPVSPQPEYPKQQLREKSSFVSVAFDNVKQKFAGAQAARRQADLKKHIRVVGPIGQYPDGSINHWV